MISQNAIKWQIRGEIMQLNESKYKRRQRIRCMDGFSMSVQADSNMYCEPRIDGIETKYTAVEVGFPSEEEILLNEHVEGGFLDNDDYFGHDTYTESVYPYVPSTVVREVIEKHGGMIGGELPLLDLATND